MSSPESTTASSELSGDLNSRTRVVDTTTKTTQPFKLQQVALAKTFKDGQTKVKTREQVIAEHAVYVYPLLAKQYADLGLQLEIDSETSNLTEISLYCKPETRTSKVTTVVLEHRLNRLNNTKGTWLVWYSWEFGITDKKQTLSAWVSHGLDYQVSLIPEHDNDGNEIMPSIGEKYQIFSVPFSKEELDKVLEGQDTDSIAFTVNYGSSSHTGFSYEEFANLPIEEVIERGKIGRQNSDLSLMFSELSTKDKVALTLQGQRAKDLKV